MKKSTIKGLVNYESGAQRARQEAGQKPEERMINDMRYLHATDKALRKALPVVDDKDIGTIDVAASDARLREYLATPDANGRIRSPGYIRNVLAYFYRIVRLADLVDLRCPEWDEFHAALVKRVAPNALADIAGWAKCAQYFEEYVRREKKTPKPGECAEEIVRGFARFLVEVRRLGRAGAARTHKRALRKVLTLYGVTFPPPRKCPTFNAVLENEIAQIRDFAVSEQDKGGKKRLFKDKFARNKRCVTPIVAVRTERFLRLYLDWLRRADSELFARGNLYLYTKQNVLERWLEEEAFEKALYTTHTANTMIDSLARVMRFGHALKLRGFEAVSPKKLEAAVHEIWQNERDGTTERLPREGVNKRIINAGGLPHYRDLYVHFLKVYGMDFAWLQKEVARLKGKAATDSEWESALRTGRDLCMAAYILTFAPRRNDLFYTLTIKHLQRVGDMFFVYFPPSKTARRQPYNPQHVEACFPPALTALVAFYLAEIQPRLNPGSQLLFPAIKRHKLRSVVAVKGDAQYGNSHEKVLRLTRKYLGKEISLNKMRKILTAIFAEFDLPGLNRFLGHVRDRSGKAKLTKPERENYLLTQSARIAKMDKRLFEILFAFLELDKPKAA